MPLEYNDVFRCPRTWGKKLIFWAGVTTNHKLWWAFENTCQRFYRIFRTVLQGMGILPFIYFFSAVLGLFRFRVWTTTRMFCGPQASHCSGFSCWGARPVVCVDLVIGSHGFSCPAACGIFPDQGSNPCPCLGRWILKHRATREVPTPILYTNKLRHRWAESLSHVTQMGADRIQLLFVQPDPLSESWTGNLIPDRWG